VADANESNELDLELGNELPDAVTPPPESGSRPNSHHAGCPRCGSARIRRSRVVPAWVTRPLTEKRLYRCSSCGWRGWKHRLEHRRKRSVKEHGRRREKLTLREILFLVVFLVGFIWWAATQSVSCRPEDEPWTPPPLGLQLHPSAPGLPELALHASQSRSATATIDPGRRG
jgi:predicted RNA-binding Zn-ribbon protein involved in translation (DUF1610 family)